MTPGAASPAISVILATDCFETVRETVEYLRRQTVAPEIELVFVAPSAAALALDPGAGAGFHSITTIEVGPFDLLQPPRAAGARAAHAPIVFFAESHCFPEPESLGALIARHREPWAIVGQVLCNANPSTRISWAGMLMDYGRQMEGMPGGQTEHLPSHNSAYKRETLTALGDQLEHLMETGDSLNGEIVARGGLLYLEDRARAHHLNVSRPGIWLSERLAVGRGYAGRRAEDWSVVRRLAYFLAWPLIPVVRLRRIHRWARWAGNADRLFPWVYPALVFGLYVASFGEALGYLGGMGAGLHTVARMELHRRPLLRDGEPTYPDL